MGRSLSVRKSFLSMVTAGDDFLRDQLASDFLSRVIFIICDFISYVEFNINDFMSHWNAHGVTLFLTFSG